jgi:hypothetical protein
MRLAGALPIVVDGARVYTIDYPRGRDLACFGERGSLELNFH